MCNCAMSKGNIFFPKLRELFRFFLLTESKTNILEVKVYILYIKQGAYINLPKY